jgi:hypothetical protein
MTAEDPAKPPAGQESITTSASHDKPHRLPGIALAIEFVLQEPRANGSTELPSRI